MIDPFDVQIEEAAWREIMGPHRGPALPADLFLAYMEAKLRMHAGLHTQIMKTLAEIDDLDSFTF